jgi:hypothetical protein
MKEQLRDWKTWALMAFIALLITVTIRMSYEVFSGNDEHIKETQRTHAVFDDRLTRLELGKVVSTAKRYTSDDAAEYAKRVDARFEAMEKRHAAHLAQVSAERIAHDNKCKMRWDSVAELKARVAMLEAMK